MRGGGPPLALESLWSIPQCGLTAKIACPDVLVFLFFFTCFLFGGLVGQFALFDSFSSVGQKTISC